MAKAKNSHAGKGARDTHKSCHSNTTFARSLFYSYNNNDVACQLEIFKIASLGLEDWVVVFCCNRVRFSVGNDKRLGSVCGGPVLLGRNQLGCTGSGSVRAEASPDLLW